MNNMKKIGRLYWMLLILLCAACNDPYEGDTFTIYDTQPAATYLSSRSNEFSEWISIMKYANLYNAVNQATQYFTLFVPTNEAVKEFYTRKGVSSIEELGTEYARNLVTYHIVQDTINQETFIAKEGLLEKKTVSDDYLSVSFGGSGNQVGGLQSVYLNKEARVIEFANLVSNGYVYVIGSTLTPLIESAYQRISESGRPYAILKAALDATGWGKELNTIYDEVTDPTTGLITLQKRNYTVLAVADDVFKKDGINNLNELAQKLGATSNYTDPENALYQYVAYHILSGSFELKKLLTFDTKEATSKIWDTAKPGSVVKVSKKDKVFYLNYADEENRATFIEDKSDTQAKNGYIHQISTYLPVAEAEPETVLFDVCNYSIIKDWIEAGNGEEGLKYQTLTNTTSELKSDLQYLSCYNVKLNNPGGTASTWYHVGYQASAGAKTGAYDWKFANNCDLLMLNLGYTGWISMQTPSIIKGKYKVTLQFGYATSMDYIRKATEGSNGGEVKVSFDGANEVTNKIYTTVTANTLGLYKFELYKELEFTETATHTFKIILNDPAASTKNNYRIYLDYLLFEPITEE